MPDVDDGVQHLTHVVDVELENLPGQTGVEEPPRERK